MKRLILHIGLERTGTSALQHFFARNRPVLRIMGVRYPRARDAAGKPSQKHQDLVEAITASAAGAAHPRHAPAADVIESYAERAEGAAATVLSAEGLGAPDPLFAEALAPLGQRFDVRVIVFLRRQDEWALSAFRQAVMDGSGGTDGIEGWLARDDTRARLDYNRILGHWEAAFGPKAVTVLRYPHDVPLVPAFIAAADLPRAAAMLPDRGTRVNESSTDEAVLAALRAQGAPAVVPALDQPARDALVAGFAAGNAAIRGRFLPSSKTLFGMR